MRADLDTMLLGKFNRVVNRTWICCMETTGNIHCGNKLNHIFVVAERIATRTTSPISALRFIFLPILLPALKRKTS